MIRNEMNIIIDNGLIVGDEAALFFSGEPIDIRPLGTDMFDLLVELGIFSSKSQALKNWKRSGRDIPLGFSDFERIGKLNNRLTILNPMKVTE